MINMSHCRFQNTELAIEECLDAMAAKDIENERERNAARRLFAKVLDFCRNEGIISDYDNVHLRKVVDYSYIKEQEEIE